MRNRLIAAAVGAAVVAGTAYAARWRWNYTHRQPEGEVDLPVPDDVAGPVDLTSDEVAVLDELADKTCMEACCVDLDEIAAYYDTE